MNSEQETVYRRFERGRNFLRLVGVSILWCIMLFPIVTFGPATVAMYHAIMKTVRSGEGRLFQEFFSCFKKNFKRTALIGTVYILLLFILLFNIYVSNRFAVYQPTQWTFLSYVYTGMLLVLGVIGCFLFPVFTHSEEKALTCVKYGLVMTFKHLFTSITCFLTLFLLIWVILYFPACLLILPGAGCALLSMVMETYLDKEIGVAYHVTSEKNKKAKKRKTDLNDIFPEPDDPPTSENQSAEKPAGSAS